jgi:hypothetical protein
VETVAVVLLVIGLLGVGFAVLTLTRLRSDVRELASRADRAARRVEALPPDLGKLLAGEDRHVISVEILNLFELAHRETWVARPLSLLTPRLLRDVIHRTVVGRVRANLATAGVDADVRLHRVR